MFLRILEIVTRVVRVILIPAYFVAVSWYVIHTYFEHEKNKAILDANVKLMCIQAHACGDDCKDI